MILLLSHMTRGGGEWINVKELASVIVVLENSKSVWLASSLETQAGLLCYSLDSEFLLWEISFCSLVLQLIG